MSEKDQERSPYKGEGGDAVKGLVAGAAGKTVPTAETKERKRPRYPSEAKRRKATYDLPEELIDQIRSIAQRETYSKKNVSVIARALLAYAVAHYEAGVISIEMVPNGDDFTPQAVESSPGK